MKLEPAMDSDVEAEAVRLAEECARTLRAYRQAEGDANHSHRAFEEWRVGCDRMWKDHEDSVDHFERTFPRVVDWRKLVPATTKDQLKRSRP